VSSSTISRAIIHHDLYGRARRPFVEHDHAEIPSAIIAGNHHRARKLMEAHVQHIIAVLEDEGLDSGEVVDWA
jgi:DNA-binding GntR family transcriptional regulator